MGSYCTLKKCNLENWEKTSFALGKAAADEQGKKQMSSRIRHLPQPGKVTCPPPPRIRQLVAWGRGQGLGIDWSYKRSQIWWVGRRHALQIHLTLAMETKIIQDCSHQ